MSAGGGGVLSVVPPTNSVHVGEFAVRRPVLRENSIGSDRPDADQDGVPPQGGSAGWLLAYGAVAQQSSGRTASGSRGGT